MFQGNVHLDRFNELARQFPREMLTECRKGFQWFLAACEKEMTPRLQGDFRDSPARTEGVARRSGVLAGSMVSRTYGESLSTLTAESRIGGGPASAYAGVQEDEQGTTITAKGKMLTIPVESPPGSGDYPALTAAGKPKWISAREANLDVLFRRAPSGRLLMFLGKKYEAKRRTFQEWKEAGAGEDTFFFALKKQVRVRGKLGFRKTFIDTWKMKGRQMINRIVKGIQAAVQRH